MVGTRWRPLLLSLFTVAVIWTVALTVYRVAKEHRMTAERFAAYAQGLDLSGLPAEARRRALQGLADRLNRLSVEERRRVRLEGTALRLFNQMTEEEKGTFVEKTLPSGFKQMLASFEQLPEDRRRRMVEDALRSLRAHRDRLETGEGEAPSDDTNAPPVLSPELEAKIKTIGLNAFYSQSSAQTKAELAPILEEMQLIMHSGRPLRERRR